MLLAHQFGVSGQSALYRLKDLKQISETEFRHLWALDEKGLGKNLASLMKLHDLDADGARDEFRHRCLALAFEAFRRSRISRGKLHELANMVQLDTGKIDALLSAVMTNSKASASQPLAPNPSGTKGS